MRNEVFVYLEIYSVYLEIYEYGKVVQGVRFPDGTGIMTCMIAMKSGTVLVFKHHHVPVQCTQYLFPLSKVKA